MALREIYATVTPARDGNYEPYYQVVRHMVGTYRGVRTLEAMTDEEGVTFLLRSLPHVEFISDIARTPWDPEDPA
jgi:hypothetical protein